MKKILLVAQIILTSMCLHAQQTQGVTLDEIPVIGISGSVSLHFISPEKISYVDLSSAALIGDLPEKNVLRIKVIPDSIPSLISRSDAGLVTVVGESFITQYKLVFLSTASVGQISTQVNILPSNMRSLDISGISLTQSDFKGNAFRLLNHEQKKPISRQSAFGMSMTVNQVFSLGDFVMLDLGFSNDTNLSFDVDELRFKIEDRKINKSTNVQSIEIKPVFQLYPFERFKKSYRNIYVLKKATFPGDKVFNIELSEKQISGRNLRVSLKYSDILNADTF
ncbi:conjugative transposon protein TraN [Pedobacter mendelii]|uniref:conjugative transposon protein TraN n=1 Tax=Pedobacter mendelii TaxID=1908240 RepID=UPI00361616C3